MRLNPLASALKTAGYLFHGRIHFPHQRLGEVLILEGGQPFRVFRPAVIDPTADQPEKPGAIFIPRFHVAGMSPRMNILFSWLPIPLIVGLPGFRSKLWLLDETTGDFAGYYEWDTVQDAENYQHSFAAWFMTGRSRPESVSCRIIPQS